jgi:hypothetical protein
MTTNIEIGRDYLLDGEHQVKVLKAINRSKTIFSVETEQQSVEMIARERLSLIEQPGMHSVQEAFSE